MSEQQLLELIDHASTFCDKLFTKKGEIVPMWHAVRSNGEQFVEIHPMELGKDMAAAIIRAQFDLMDVVRYVYMGEAWTLQSRNIGVDRVDAAIKQGSIAEHPDRIEIVMIQGEDREFGQVLAQRCILRDGKPRLGPLEIVIQPGGRGSSEGRMIGMLPARGTRQ